MLKGSSRRSSLSNGNNGNGSVVATLRRSMGSRNGSERQYANGEHEQGRGGGDGIIKIPVVGYEVKEETGRFTVFKLQVSSEDMNDSWLVFRRYTDFERLSAKLKEEFPQLPIISLPPKRWLKNNFDITFLEDRMKGIQAFVDSILIQNKLSKIETVRTFFCLDEPPMYPENAEESRAIFGTLEEDIIQLKEDLNNRDKEIRLLKQEMEILKIRNESLVKLSTTCSSCNTRLSNDILSSVRIPILASTPNGHSDTYVIRTRINSASSGSAMESQSVPGTPKRKLGFQTKRRVTSVGSLSLTDTGPLTPATPANPIPQRFPTSANYSTTEHYYSANETLQSNTVGDPDPGLGLGDSDTLSSPFEFLPPTPASCSALDKTSFEVLSPSSLTLDPAQSTSDNNHNKIPVSCT